MSCSESIGRASAKCCSDCCGRPQFQRDRGGGCASCSARDCTAASSSSLGTVWLMSPIWTAEPPPCDRSEPGRVRAALRPSETVKPGPSSERGRSISARRMSRCPLRPRSAAADEGECSRHGVALDLGDEDAASRGRGPAPQSRRGGECLVFVGASAHQGQVRAGAEGPACTGEDDDSDVGVLPRYLDCKDQLVD